jgi:hypothetical protein
MPAAINIGDILSQVRQLNKEDQLTLLEKIILLIRKKEAKNKPANLSMLSGVGSEIWSGTNIDDYIERERRW